MFSYWKSLIVISDLVCVPLYARNCPNFAYIRICSSGLTSVYRFSIGHTNTVGNQANAKQESVKVRLWKGVSIGLMIRMLQQPLGALLRAHFGESSWGHICAGNVVGCMNSFEAKKTPPLTTLLRHVSLDCRKDEKRWISHNAWSCNTDFLVSAGWI